MLCHLKANRVSVFSKLATELPEPVYSLGVVKNLYRIKGDQNKINRDNNEYIIIQFNNTNKWKNLPPGNGRMH